MDISFKICITFKFSDFVIRSLLSAGGPYLKSNTFIKHTRHDKLGLEWKLMSVFCSSPITRFDFKLEIASITMLEFRSDFVIYYLG